MKILVSVFAAVSILMLILLCYWHYWGFSHNYLLTAPNVGRIQIFKNEQQVAGAEIWQHSFSNGKEKKRIDQICSFFENNVSQIGLEDRWLIYSAVFDDPDQTGEKSITIYFNSHVYAANGCSGRMPKHVFDLLTTKK